MCFHGNQHPWAIKHPFISLYSKYQSFKYICLPVRNSPIFPSLDDIHCTFLALYNIFPINLLQLNCVTSGCNGIPDSRQYETKEQIKKYYENILKNSSSRIFAAGKNALSLLLLFYLYKLVSFTLSACLS